MHFTSGWWLHESHSDFHQVFPIEIKAQLVGGVSLQIREPTIEAFSLTQPQKGYPQMSLILANALIGGSTARNDVLCVSKRVKGVTCGFASRLGPRFHAKGTKTQPTFQRILAVHKSRWPMARDLWVELDASRWLVLKL